MFYSKGTPKFLLPIPYAPEIFVARIAVFVFSAGKESLDKPAIPIFLKLLALQRSRILSYSRAKDANA